MKKLTARITMSVTVTDEEYLRIVGDGNHDVNVSGDLMELFKANGKVDEDYGDSYIPEPWIDVDRKKTPCDYPDANGEYHCPFEDYGGSDRCRACCGLGVDEDSYPEEDCYEGYI